MTVDHASIGAQAPAARVIESPQRQSSLGERISHWAVATPAAPAIEYGGTVLSYIDLQRRIVHLAAWMQRRGVVPGEIVALNCERSAEMVMGMLAAWRSGAAFLPLDPAWPAARRQLILEQASPSLIVRGSGCASVSSQELDLQGLDFDPLPAALASWPAHPSDLAYVIFTSGSTGAPKGVMVEHAQLSNYAAAVSAALGLQEVRRWGVVGSLAADLGYTALFGGLFNGACIVIATAAEARDAGSFERFMRSRHIDGLKIVPSHLDALLESEQPALPRKLILGGESTPRQLVERVLRLAPECRIYNHYGPTETTIGVMVHAVDPERDSDDVPPLTTVLSNCSVHVLDATLQAVPVGAVGEIYIGGAQVCRGYCGEHDAAAFICDERFGADRLYRTGDLARRLSSGGLRIVGRGDDQVKVNGFRVEPAEIEAALLGLDGVRQAAVVARTSEAFSVELVAFVVAPTADELQATQSLRRALAETLPTYMQPGSYVFLDQMPRLANGKIDRRQLQCLQTNVSRAGESAAAPIDPIQSAVAHLMAQLLKRDTVGVDEDFIALGGHSLLVIKLVARIRRRLGVEIQPSTVFEHCTPAALAAVLREAGATAAELEA